MLVDTGIIYVNNIKCVRERSNSFHRLNKLKANKKKQCPVFAVYKWFTLNLKTHGLRVKGYSKQMVIKRVGIALLTLDKISFK